MSAVHRQQKTRIAMLEAQLSMKADMIRCYERVAADLLANHFLRPDSVTLSVINGALNVMRNDHYVLSRDLETEQARLAAMQKRKL